MCGGKGKSVTPPVVPLPQPVPQEADPAIVNARESDRLRRLRASGANDTLITGGHGVLGQANTASGSKQLFGV